MGFLAAALAVARDDRRLGWVAIGFLGFSLGTRVLQAHPAADAGQAGRARPTPRSDPQARVPARAAAIPIACQAGRNSPCVTIPLIERLDAARAALLRHFGFPEFRPMQRRVVQSVLAGRDTLAVLPTGGGKSVCFQVPAMVLPGLTVVVSPLLSLMQDQVEAALRRGLPAAALNSTQEGAERAAVLEAVRGGALRFTGAGRC